jgi:hypothetical protein
MPATGPRRIDLAQFPTGKVMACTVGLARRADAHAKMGQLIFRCPNTGKEFATGFEASSADLIGFPPSATIRLRCRICAQTHEFKFSDARIEEDVNPAQINPAQVARP